MTTGFVTSRLIVTLFVAGPPSLEAEQVNVSVSPSVVTDVVSQPVCPVTVLWASVTDHEMLTAPLYQPFAPCAPVTVSVITGGVESVTVTAAVAVSANGSP